MRPASRSFVSAASVSRTPSLRVTGIIANNSIAFVESVFACFAADKPVVILKDVADKSLTSHLDVENIINPPTSSGWARLAFKPLRSHRLAQVAFTSGTEGAPKGIMITHANLADMVERLNSVMQMDSSIREYVGVPVYHSFGFGRCRAVSTLGGAFYIPPQGFDPVEIQQMLARDEINAISAVPSLWRTLFEHEELFGDEVKRVKWIEIGSQYMSGAEKLRLRRLFPEACIVQHYGLTEASRATFLRIDQTDSLEALESVGRPAGDTDIKITTDGRIAIRGSLVARQMLRGNLCEPLVDSEGWLVTSDLGELRAGYLTYRGRADDMINCGGVKISPDNLEQRIREKAGLERGIAVCRIDDALRGNGVLVAHLKDLQVERQQLESCARAALAEMRVNVGRSLKLLEIDAFPVTATGKVKRRELAKLAQLQPALPATARTPPEEELVPLLDASPRELELVALWQELLNIDSVSLHESFHDLGGDSLTAISAIVKMRKLGVPEQVCRGILQGKTIAEIARDEKALGAEAGRQDLSNRRASAAKNALNIKFVRGLLVLIVVSAHWAEGFFARLPESLQGLWSAFAPVFSFGTPGFAVMYGVAMGYGFYPLFCKTPERFKKLLWPIFNLLLAGVVVLAGAKMLHHYLEHGSLSLTDVTNSFYGVLTYYLFATASLYGIFWLLAKSRAPVVTALVGAVLLHLFYVRYMDPLTAVPMEGLVELGKLIIAAKFSYFNMTCGVLIGLAVGIALTDESRFNLRMPAALALAAMAIIGGIWLASVAGASDSWFVWPAARVPAWKWMFYAGACLALLVAMDRLLNFYHRLPRWTLMPINLVACFGLLAFPVFVGHELVLPLKDLLEAVGLSNGLALVSVLALFGAGCGYVVYRSYKLQFD